MGYNKISKMIQKDKTERIKGQEGGIIPCCS